MTANQIANASVMETVRHDQAYEQETNRHNIATEEIAKEQLSIDRYKADLDRDFKNSTVELQKQQMLLTYELNRTQGDQKIRVQEQLAQVEKDRAEVYRKYSQDMAAVAEAEKDIKNKEYIEHKSHNAAMETYQSESNDLTRKRLEYEKTMFDTEMQLKNLKVANEYSLGLSQMQNAFLQTQLEVVKLKEKQRQFDLGYQLDQISKTTGSIRDLGDFFKNTTQGISNIFRLVP